MPMASFEGGGGSMRGGLPSHLGGSGISPG